MPRANTDLAEILSGDRVLCVQRQSCSAAAQQVPGPSLSPENDHTPPEAAADDPDLARVNKAWPTLPGNIRAAIAALVGEKPADDK